MFFMITRLVLHEFRVNQEHPYQNIGRDLYLAVKSQLVAATFSA